MPTPAAADKCGATCCCMHTGVLHAVLACAATQQPVCRILAGWKQQPLVAALTTQQVRHNSWHDTHANHGSSCTQLHSVNCLPSHTKQWQHSQHSRCVTIIGMAWHGMA
jgi:hypothetical protein